MSGKAIAIAGPTASGKSAFAMEKAEALVAAGHGAVIVNTDSMQVYPVLRVLTARPGAQDLARADHVLYGHAALNEPYSVARWADDVAALLPQWRAAGVVPIFTGGTGLYFRALETGLSEVPAIDPAVRTKVRKDLIANGSEALHARLANLDPEGAASLRPSDGQRIARALEVVESTARPLAEHHQGGASPLLDGWQVERFIVEPPRPVLHDRIENRAGKMLEEGALAEVEELLRLDPPSDATVWKAIGVSQLAAHLRGETSREEAVDKMIAATRQYAKRQSTWFRGQMGPGWQRI